MVDSLSTRERELFDAISQAQLAENSAAARKASAIREFALARAAALTSVGDVEPVKVERKIVAEVAVACRVSPFQRRRRLHLARDPHLGLDHVRELFTSGELAEDKAQKVVAATAHLDREERALVERLTGQTTARDVAVEVQVVVPVEALLDPSSPLPAQISGHGSIPADIAREILASTAGKKTLRRLVTRDGIVIGGDSRRRTFDGALETFIRARDGNRCTAPYCDALVRHIDHKQRWADGGPTEFTNGDGMCEFHNHAREPLSPTSCTPPSPGSRAKGRTGSARPPSRAGAARPGRARPTPVS